jgi:putative heme-binding domain-containing protein
MVSRSFLLALGWGAWLLLRPGAGLGAEDRAVSTERAARSARERPGDPRRGRVLFADAGRAACVRCHRVRGEGGSVGPDLSDVGGKLDRDQLIEAVLAPSRQIVEGYRPTLIATAGGRVVTGVVRAEGEGTLTLVDGAGRVETFARRDVDERKPLDTSLMPDGLASGLSPEEFADLIAYLASLRASGQGTPGSGVVGPVALPAGFTRAQVASGVTGATAMEVAPDGRVFLCEQTGALRVVRGGVLAPEPVLRVAVDSRWERGLLGVALDPGFARNGYVYVFHVVAEPYPHHRLSRFTLRGDRAEPGSERVLFEGDDQGTLGGAKPDGHQGGAVHFGADGKLYVAVGDQTAGAPAQRLDTLQGKLLRLNPDGSVPDDNPFAREARGKYRAIWARGLRNPFTFAVQPGTGRILINDVGEARWEEIDEGRAGANYGWPLAEGPSTDPRFRAPLFAYPVASVAGGAFCPTGAAAGFPAACRGKYFFADYVKGWIKVLDPDHPERPETFATGFARPVDLKFAPGGDLLVLLRDAWVKDAHFRPGTGSLHRIRFEGDRP